MTSHVARSSGALTSSANPLTKPVGTIEGDLMVAVLNSATAISVKPSGWTEVRYAANDSLEAPAHWTWIGYRIAGASEPTSWSYTTGTGDTAFVVHTYRPGTYGWTASPVALTYAYDSTSDTAWVVPSASPATAAMAMAVVDRFGIEAFSATAVDNGFSLRNPGASDTQTGIFTADKSVSAGAIGATTFTGGVAARTAGYMLVLSEVINGAPYTGTPTYPTGSISIDRGSVQRFRSTFSDPDAGDSQSRLDIRYRIVGAGSWTTVSTVTPNPYVEFPAGTFTADDYEWQSLPYDSLGVPAAAWSASAFFTAVDTPAGPTFTSPVSGATISSSSQLFTFSYPTLTEYQWRVLGDLAGVADTSNVINAATVVTNAASRSFLAHDLPNGETVHVQVQAKDGVYSDWVDTSNPVSFTAPAVPTAVVTADAPAGAITVSSTHPTPSGSEPTVTSYNVWRFVVGDSDDGIRVAAGVIPAAAFTDYAVTSGVDYEYQVEDIGDNGTSSFSARAGGVGDVYTDGGTAAGSFLDGLDGGDALTASFVSTFDGGAA